MEHNTTPREDREAKRHPTLALATLVVEEGAADESGATLSGCVLNVSRTGLGMRCARPPAVGTRVWLELDLEGEALKGLATVVHASRAQRAVGLEFLELPCTSLAKLLRFVRLQETGRKEPGRTPELTV